MRPEARRGRRSYPNNSICPLVRPSGAEPLIRIMAEGDDPRLVNEVVEQVAGAVKAAAA